MVEKERKIINMDIGSRLKHHRKALGYSREHFAAELGISARFLADAERGSVGMSLTTLKKACEELNISSDALIWGEPQHTSIDVLLRGMPPQYIEVIAAIVKKQIELVEMAEHNHTK